MNEKDKANLIKNNSIEIINESNISSILKNKDVSVYCGYEPSGPIHLGHLVTIIKLMEMQKAGVKPIILLADWHAWLNKKGDWKFINNETKNWESGIKATGLKAKFIKGTDFQKKPEYISEVMSLALEATIKRGLRSMQEVARDIENAKISQLIYPLMQIEDIKFLNVDFVISGLEQRKIHALATELLPKLNHNKKPVFIHTGIITSLKGPGGKMSSSISESMISIKDSKQEIDKKIKNTHCISGETKENPILEISRYLLFPKFEKITINRDKKHGGNLTYRSYTELEDDFKNKKLHPLDLKNSVSNYLNQLIDPIRKSFK